MFCSMIGTPLDPSNVRKRFRELLTAAGLEQRRFHDLRHSCGTFLAAHNVHPRTIMQILGHSQISTTMNDYTYTELDSMRSSLDSPQRPIRVRHAIELARFAAIVNRPARGSHAGTEETP